MQEAPCPLGKSYFVTSQSQPVQWQFPPQLQLASHPLTLHDPSSQQLQRPALLHPTNAKHAAIANSAKSFFMDISFGLVVSLRQQLLVPLLCRFLRR